MTLCKIPLCYFLARGNKPIVTKLAEYLTRNGLSQTEFCSSAGVKEPMVSQWCSGTRRPGLSNALLIERETKGAIPAVYWTTVKTVPPKQPRRRPRKTA